MSGDDFYPETMREVGLVLDIFAKASDDATVGEIRAAADAAVLKLRSDIGRDRLLRACKKAQGL